MNGFKMIAASLLTAGVAMGAPAVYATTVTQLTSASQLDGNDTKLGIVSTTQPVGTVSAGNSISFVTGDLLTFSRGSGQFEVDQAGTNYGDTSFSNGTNLVGAGGFQGSGDGGPVTLTFKTAVTQFGLNIEDFNGGAYEVGFTAYDTTGANLGTFLASGNDPLSGVGGTLSFEGLIATTGSISYVTFNDGINPLVGNLGGSNDLMFGNVDFLPVGVKGQAPTVTPEPSSILLLGSGLMSMAAFGRRAIVRRRNA